MSTPAPQASPSARVRLSRPERRAHLLAVAAPVLVRLGHGTTKFDDIAKAAGVTRPLLYSYFRSVDEIHLECHRVARERMRALLFEAVAAADADAAAQLRAGLGAYFRFVQQEPVSFDLLYGPGSAGGALSEQASDLRFGTAQQIAALFLAAAPHLPADEAVAHAHLVSGAAEQLAKWWRRNQHVELEWVVNRSFIVVWTGLETLTVQGPSDEAP